MTCLLKPVLENRKKSHHDENKDDLIPNKKEKYKKKFE